MRQAPRRDRAPLTLARSCLPAQGYANVPSSDALSPPSSASDAFPTPTRDRGEEGEKAQLVASDPPVAAAQAPATHTGWGLLRDSLVLWACSAYGLLALVYIVLDEGLPLFLKAPAERGVRPAQRVLLPAATHAPAPRAGGLSFSSAMIGIALSVSGLELIVFTLCFSPRIMRRLGNFVAFRCGRWRVGRLARPALTCAVRAAGRRWVPCWRRCPFPPCFTCAPTLWRCGWAWSWCV